MTIWTGPEAKKKNTLERMLCLHCDRQRKNVKSPFDFARAFLLNKNSGSNLWNFLVASGTAFFGIYRKEDDDHRERIFVLFDNCWSFRKMPRKFSCHLPRFPKSLNFWSNGERPKSQITKDKLFFTILVTWSSCWFALEGVRGDLRVQRTLRHPEWRKQVVVPQFLRAASLGLAGRGRRTSSGKKGRNWHFKGHRKSQNVNL